MERKHLLQGHITVLLITVLFHEQSQLLSEQFFDYSIINPK